MLIRNVRLLSGQAVDVRVEGGRIASIGPAPVAGSDSHVLDGAGGLLIRGLHDHHVHVAASAAALRSIACGPPLVTNAAELAQALAAAPGEDWLRGVGYHESVAGELDRQWLDAAVRDRPARVQHRSGRMWTFNSAGLDRVLASGHPPPAGLDQAAGRLFDEDAWLRLALGSKPPDFSAVGKRWARWGVTGVTDMNPQNDLAAAAHFADQQAVGRLPQRVMLAGRPELNAASWTERLRLGPVKVHLHEAHLPEHDALIDLIRTAHNHGRAVAVHCVTETELVFTLAAFADAGGVTGDRIEHASVAPDALVSEVARLGLAIVAQPNFVAERGDTYLRDIAPAEWPHLYRLRSFVRAGVTLAGGTDTPFGGADPWAAMAAAVSRRTSAGQPLGLGEALTPEEALGLFLADPADLSVQRNVEVGAKADLCLLEQDWPALRGNLAAAHVRATLIGGEVVHG